MPRLGLGLGLGSDLGTATAPIPANGLTFNGVQVTFNGVIVTFTIVDTITYPAGTTINDTVPAGYVYADVYVQSSASGGMTTAGYGGGAAVALNVAVIAGQAVTGSVGAGVTANNNGQPSNLYINSVEIAYATGGTYNNIPGSGTVGTYLYTGGARNGSLGGGGAGIGGSASGQTGGSGIPPAAVSYPLSVPGGNGGGNGQAGNAPGGAPGHGGSPSGGGLVTIVYKNTLN